MNKKSLLEKIQIVLDKYNNGEDNSYSLVMKHTIEHMDELYIIETIDSLIDIDDGKCPRVLTLKELIGICILDNNPDLFESKELEPPMMGMSY